MNIKLLFELFMTFMKIGAFTLGGGNAMLPVIKHEVVVNKKWISEEEMTDYMVIGQSLPGVIAINTATSVGYKVHGVLGGFIATMGMIVPSYVIIVIIAIFFNQFQENAVMQRAFTGVRAAIVALIFVTVVDMYKNAVKYNFQLVIAILAAVGILFFNISAPLIILGSAIISLVWVKINHGKFN